MDSIKMMGIATGITMLSICTNGQTNNTMNNTMNSTVVLETTSEFDFSSTMFHTTFDNDDEDAPWYDIDQWTVNPLEWEIYQYVVAGVIVFFLILCIGSCSWWCCCRKKGDDDENGHNFMTNPQRYDSEFPGAEMQTFAPQNQQTRGVNYVE